MVGDVCNWQLTPRAGESVTVVAAIVDIARASWEPVDGAAIHQVQYRDAVNEIVLEITVLDDSADVLIPSLLELPSGALTARISGIGADLDVTDFSLDEDRDKLFGIAAEPTDVP